MAICTEGEAGIAVRLALFLPLLAALRFTGHAGGSQQFTHDPDTRLRAQRAGQALLPVSHAFLLPVSAAEVRPIRPLSGCFCRNRMMATQLLPALFVFGQPGPRDGPFQVG